MKKLLFNFFLILWAWSSSQNIDVLRLEAEKGDQAAQFRLGMLYEEGEDYAEAMKWYRSAAEQGDAGAQSSLGLNYLMGRGIPQDYVGAHFWFNLAAVRGDKNAEKLRDSVSLRMTPEQVAEAQRLAREWKPYKGDIY